MREKELRLALVYFGGVSLAIYMHGVGKEFLKLVRASAALHAITDPAARDDAQFFDRADRGDSEYDTEPVYFDLLREIGRTLRLRVVVDIIAGASAGGINGTMLARALAHDLPMGGLRDLWLAEADVDRLLAPEARARKWSKRFMSPFVWAVGASGKFGSILDPEVRQNLALFVRSRWFEPPLDGSHMSELMLRGLRTMGEPKDSRASLLPSGHSLDLFVTVTDYYGCPQLMPIHDPPVISELEHRHVLHFGYRRTANGDVASDFELENAPALAFAARATSSFPGVFPPAQIIEIDNMVAQYGLTWSTRGAFLAHNFSNYIQIGYDPVMAPFIDGAVLNNKPFREAIRAIAGRPAYRQVDRRLIYIDPDAQVPPAAVRTRVPGFFTTLKSSLSDLPRTQPIGNELNWVVGFNERVRQQRGIIESARPQITRLVADTVDEPLDQPASANQIRTWRERINAQVVQDAGFAYEGYARQKLTSVRTLVSGVIAMLNEAPLHSPLARAIHAIIDAWATQAGATYQPGDRRVLGIETSGSGEPLPKWVRFLLAFDVDFRKRRLHFLIQGQNRLYETQGGAANGFDPQNINRLKREFYGCLEVLRQHEEPQFFSTETRALARKIFAAPPTADEAQRITDYSEKFAARHAEDIEALVERLAAEINLDATTGDIDALLGNMDATQLSPEIRREVLVNYLGFPFWDLLTFSVTTWRDAGEFQEIKVDRMSPEDSPSLPGFNSGKALKGLAIGHFAAFLSRTYRENDYLLGRLHAVDRLIDIVCDSAGIMDNHGIDVRSVKKRAFATILDVEEKHLPKSAALVAALRRLVMQI